MLNSRRATPWLVAALSLCGAVCLGLRLYIRHELRMVQGDSFWRLTYDIRFRAAKAGVRLRAAIPSDSIHCRVFRQELRFAGLNTERLLPSRTGTRELRVATQRSGEFHLVARFGVHVSRDAILRRPSGNTILDAEDRARYLRSSPTIQVNSPTVTRTLQPLQATATDKAQLVERLFEYCHAQISATADGQDAPSDAAGALESRRATPLGRAGALVALCRAAKIPARLVSGFDLHGDSATAPIVWVEVLTNHHWEPYDPDNGFQRELPRSFLAVRHDGVDGIIRAPDAVILRSDYSLARLPPGDQMAGRRRHRLSDILDLTRLPLEMHEVLSILLLFPLGALVTSVFRTLIGFRTFGTFTPTLLALSFVYADWRTGLVVLVVTVGLGIMTRTMLDRLKLLMVPRLSVILTLVVACMVLSVSVLDYWGWTPSAQAVLLPMVIVTSTIERLFVTIEEDGPRFALQLLASTMVLAFFCYLVLRWESVGRLLLTYPEFHFFTVGILVGLGRYTGYRLTELWRFRDFVPPEG